MSQKQVESATSADIQRVIVTSCNNSGKEDCLLTAQSVINVDDMCTPSKESKKMSCKSRTSSFLSKTKKESMDKLMESLEKKMKDQLGAISILFKTWVLLKLWHRNKRYWNLFWPGRHHGHLRDSKVVHVQQSQVPVWTGKNNMINGSYISNRGR